VMGVYHPHGDSAIYDAMVRMAQDFSMRLPLIDGQGNFGSMDADPPAAMRYTEARLAKVAATALLEDIDKDTVDFVPNYDESTTEPSVLPARFPNLLVNGAGGIAVGMATNIPTHNLGEVIDATLAWIADPEITVDQLLQIMPGPDFPTGGVILGRAGVRSAYETGRGSILMRAACAIEEIRKDREAIVVTEIPYQVNKAKLVERIAELVNEKTIEGISDLRDESDRDGVRIVIELKRDASGEVVLNQLYRHTPLQTSFGANMLALDGGRPDVMPLKRILGAFVAFREEVIRRRTAFELAKARERAHLLVGLAIAVANIDPIIAAIRNAPNPEEARKALMGRAWPADAVAPLIALVDDAAAIGEDGYRLSDAQARGILELRLQRLTGLEREKIGDELKQLVDKIADYLKILSDRDRLLEVLIGELEAVKAEFDTPRRTRFEEHAGDFDIEDLIEREDMVVTVTHAGYVKRTPLSTYRAQKRGGRGRSGMATRDEDFVSQVFVASTHAPLLVFTGRGMVYKLKVHRLPFGQPQARGKPLVNMLPVEAGETVAAVLALPEDESEWEGRSILFATSGGTVRRNDLSDFTNVKANGKIAMKLEDEAGASLGRLVGVRICSEAQDVLLATRMGQCIRFPVADLRVFTGRNSIGVRGIKLSGEDDVIALSILNATDAAADERERYIRVAAALRSADDGDAADLDADLQAYAQSERFAALQAEEEFILTVTEKGFGKRTSAYAYRRTGRGGQGVANVDITAKNGPAVAVFPAPPDLQIMMVTDGGQLIRCPVHDVRIAGRKTQGVTLIRVADGERVVSAAPILDDGAEEGVDDGPEGGAGDDAE